MDKDIHRFDRTPWENLVLHPPLPFPSILLGNAECKPQISAECTIYYNEKSSIRITPILCWKKIERVLHKYDAPSEHWYKCINKSLASFPTIYYLTGCLLPPLGEAQCLGMYTVTIDCKGSRKITLYWAPPNGSCNKMFCMLGTEERVQCPPPIPSTFLLGTIVAVWSTSMEGTPLLMLYPITLKMCIPF